MALRYLALNDQLRPHLCRMRSNAAEPLPQALRAETEALGEVSIWQIGEEEGMLLGLAT